MFRACSQMSMHVETVCEVNDVDVHVGDVAHMLGIKLRRGWFM